MLISVFGLVQRWQKIELQLYWIVANELYENQNLEAYTLRLINMVTNHIFMNAF